MTKLRKKLQDKLRRKYKYETNTRANTGTTIIKPNAQITHHVNSNNQNYDLITDIAINMDHFWFKCDHGKNAITLYLTQYIDKLNGENITEQSELSASISFEEFETLYKIICEMKKEAQEIYPDIK